MFVLFGAMGARGKSGERAACSTRGDGLARHGDGRGPIGRCVGHNEGGGGVEYDHVQVRAGVAVEDRPEDASGVVEVGGLNLGEGGARQAERYGVEGLSRDLAIADDRERGRRGDGEFVEAVVAVCDDRVRGTEAGEGVSDVTDEKRVIHADELAGCCGGVGHWTKRVEDGRVRECAAGRAGKTHRGMMVDGEAEADAGLAKAACLNGGRCIDVNAERSEDFGAAAPGAAAIAVLGDEDADRSGGCGRSDERGGGGDIESLGRSARAARVDHLMALGWFERNGRDMGAHHAGSTDDLVDGCAAGVEFGEQTLDAFFAEFTSENRGEEVVSLGLVEGHARIDVGQERQRAW